jgi:hypothetical protein
MKALKFLLIFCFPLTAFSQADNSELQKMHNEDQDARKVKNMDWSIVGRQDKERQIRVFELIKLNQVVTAKDYYNSAMIF